ncbi:Mal d 1-associated protein [Thalictrum thalictroides]|uniref:Mal d 1-associated protein n=1 Tax=Thalictrum thalictroides TaxID=46969 RepID=A0A7J6WKI9_THATH|nr:Mal d 1-associated protein [Thalictrum thalictroides]
MGWVWKDDEDTSSSAIGIRGNDNNDLQNPNSSFSSSTQKVVRSQCKTEQVEPGKFVRKCEKTEEIFKSCGAGKPLELVKSNTEYTEDDVTNEMTRGGSSFSLFSSEDKPFNFPRLRSDIEAIEKSLSGGLGHFLDAAEEMKNGFFREFGAPFEKEFPSPFRRGIPIKEGPSEEFPNRQKKDESTFADLADQVTDV